MYRCLLQLPQILSCPGTIPQGVRYEGLIEGLDLYPTLLDLMGIPISQRINGRSFKEALITGDDPGRSDVYAEYLRYGHSVAALRDTRWNFVWHGATGECELYDLQADPHERFNLAGEAQYADVVRERTARLLSRMMINRDVDLLPPDAQISRSPIYLTPGRDLQGHIRASIRMARGEQGVDWWPTTR
jgi:arylsulfatase A-like enzyme